MTNSYPKHLLWGACCSLVLMAATGCQKSYEIKSVTGSRYEITAALDSCPRDTTAEQLLIPYKKVVDSIKAPVLGQSAMAMEGGRPESLLANFAADALYEMAGKVSGKPVDMALANMGGLRNKMPQGTITYGDVYNIFPFENSLCIMELTGENLTKLFENIASTKGECISHARLEIGADGRLLKATIGGKAVDPAKSYRLATLDYLAEGNDNMKALTLGTNRQFPKDATIRALIVNYIKEKTAQGKEITSALDGRIKITGEVGPPKK